MVTPVFDHLEPGTPEAVWASCAGLTEAPELDLSGLRHLVVVAAHPDDECLGAGGLIATALGAAVPVTVVVATDGEASHPRSPTHTSHALRKRRRAELRAALATLAVGCPRPAEVTALGLPDGRLSECSPALDVAIDAALAVPAPVSPERPGVPGRGEPDRLEPYAGAAGTWVVAPLRGDGHPDHDAAGAAAARSSRDGRARLLEYPVWTWHWATPSTAPWPWSALWRLPLDRPALARKASALRAYVSQTAPLSAAPGDEAVVPPGFAEHFARPWEMFVASVPAGEPTLAAG